MNNIAPINEYLPEKVDFDREMASDFNTSNALSVIFGFIKSINKQLRNAQVDYQWLAKALTTYEYMLDIFGIRPR